jgi:hypothetical protein
MREMLDYNILYDTQFLSEFGLYHKNDHEDSN